MNTLSPFSSSPASISALTKAFMYQNQAAMLASTTFFSGQSLQDTVDFSQSALDSSFFTSLIQSGNSAVFGTIYSDKDAFNQSLIAGVTATAGFNISPSDSLLGQLINLAA